MKKKNEKRPPNEPPEGLTWGCALPPGCDPHVPREVPTKAAAWAAGGGPGQGQASVQAHVLRDGEAAQWRRCHIPRCPEVCSEGHSQGDSAWWSPEIKVELLRGFVNIINKSVQNLKSHIAMDIKGTTHPRHEVAFLTVPQSSFPVRCDRQWPDVQSADTRRDLRLGFPPLHSRVTALSCLSEATCSWSPHLWQKRG